MREYTEKQKALISALEREDWKTIESLTECKFPAEPEPRPEPRIPIAHCEICGTACDGKLCHLHARSTKSTIAKVAWSYLKFVKKKNLQEDHQDKIITLIASSYTVDEIARMIGLSPKTIAYHMAVIRKRLKLKKRDVAGITRYAIKNGLITLSCLIFLAILGCKVPATQPVSKPVATTPPPLPLLKVQPVPDAVTVPPTPPGMTNVHLAWNPSTSPLTSGYRMYQGIKSGTYTNIFLVGNSTNAYVNSPTGVTNYYAVTAISTNGAESVFSNEATLSIPTTLKKTVVNFQAVIQTNSTLNTNLWGNYYTYPVYSVTNPPDFQFYRVDLLINSTTQ